MQNIKFGHKVNTPTSLKGMFYVNPSLLQIYNKIYEDDKKRSEMMQFSFGTIYSETKNDSFEKLVAILNQIGHDNNINIFKNDYCDYNKLSFCLYGTYKGEPFDLYDWKCDCSIHIGGTENLDIHGLCDELHEIIKNTQPLSYKMNCHYDDVEYQY